MSKLYFVFSGDQVLGLYEGDILLSKEQVLGVTGDGSSAAARSARAVVPHASKKWAEGVVPYVLSPLLSKSNICNFPCIIIMECGKAGDKISHPFCKKHGIFYHMLCPIYSLLLGAQSTTGGRLSFWQRLLHCSTFLDATHHTWSGVCANRAIGQPWQLPIANAAGINQGNEVFCLGEADWSQPAIPPGTLPWMQLC